MVSDARILVTRLLAIAVTSFMVIRREERYLEARLGEGRVPPKFMVI